MDHFLGPPPQKPHSVYGPPKQQFSIPKPIYGLPIKPPVNFRPQQPQQTYGVPSQQFQQIQQFQQFQQLQPLQPLPAQIRQPLPAYGPPALPNIQKPIHGAGCDGWKPIPGPSIGTQQAIAHSNIATIQSVIPENSYLPPPSNSLHAVDDANLQVQPLPTNLQLPSAGPSNFYHHDLGANLGASLSSGLGLTSINVIKSEGIEVCLCTNCCLGDHDFFFSESTIFFLSLSFTASK